MGEMMTLVFQLFGLRDDASHLVLSFLVVDIIYSTLESIASRILTQFSDEAALSFWKI